MYLKEIVFLPLYLKKACRAGLNIKDFPPSRGNLKMASGKLE